MTVHLIYSDIKFVSGDLCSFHREKSDKPSKHLRAPFDGELSEKKVFYNLLSNGTDILLNINGISHLVVIVNDHKKRGNETSPVLRLTPEVAEMFKVKSEGNVPCQFKVINTNTSPFNDLRMFLYVSGFLLFAIGLAMFSL